MIFLHGFGFYGVVSTIGQSGLTRNPESDKRFITERISAMTFIKLDSAGSGLPLGRNRAAIGAGLCSDATADMEYDNNLRCRWRTNPWPLTIFLLRLGIWSWIYEWLWSAEIRRAGDRLLRRRFSSLYAESGSLLHRTVTWTYDRK